MTVWVITGCSSGIGACFARALIARGDRVVATARDIDALQGLAKIGATTLELDVTASPEVLHEKAQQAIAAYGHVDVLLNNAGYMEFGTFEDLTTERLRAQFETNVFGMHKVTQAFLPYFRERKGGWILAVSSSTSWHAAPVCGAYAASKRAVEGLMETLTEEVKPFGIKTLVVSPGTFDTDIFLPHKHTIRASQAYEQITQGTVGFLTMGQFKPTGDLDKLAALVIALVHGEGGARGREVPWRMLAGTDIYEYALNACNTVLRQLKDWEKVIKSTDKDEK